MYLTKPFSSSETTPTQLHMMVHRTLHRVTTANTLLLTWQVSLVVYININTSLTQYYRLQLIQGCDKLKDMTLSLKHQGKFWVVEILD